MKIPNTFTMQWHVTERCNWNCKHCYQNKDYINEEVSYLELLEFFNQFINAIEKWGIPEESAFLTLGGGEPFIRKDFIEFLTHIRRNKKSLRIRLMSNGSFIDAAIAKYLAGLNLDGFQVSLEGDRQYNDKIRGEGSYDSVLRTIKILSFYGIRPHVSMTITRKNIDLVPKLANAVYKAGAVNLKTRRLVPIGRGASMKNELLSPQELKYFYENILRTNKLLKGKNFRLIIGCEGSLINEQVDKESNLINQCGLIDGRILTLMPNGDVFPCRRLPIKIGNLKDDNLYNIWENSKLLRDLRNKNNAHSFCKKCPNFDQCFGGAKCITYGLTNRLFEPDPQCWRYHNNTC